MKQAMARSRSVTSQPGPSAWSPSTTWSASWSGRSSSTITAVRPSPPSNVPGEALEGQDAVGPEGEPDDRVGHHELDGDIADLIRPQAARLARQARGVEGCAAGHERVDVLAQRARPDAIPRVDRRRPEE